MKAKFAGHDSFPLRHGWLYKAINFINSDGVLSISNDDHLSKAISEMGIGKNMVKSLRYWTDMVGFLEEDSDDNTIITELGKTIFDHMDGFDPYMEDIGTVWLIHFLLNFDDTNLTAYRYFFNYSNVSYFESSKLVEDTHESVLRLTDSNQFAIATVKKDVTCLLGTYSVKKMKVVSEDSFASPLSDLGLIDNLGGGYYQTNYGHKPTLPTDIFLYAMIRFFNYVNIDSKINTVSFEHILTQAGSPGKIFKMTEGSLGAMLDAIVSSRIDVTWIDSLGLRQVSISDDLLKNPEQLLTEYYNGEEA